MPFPRPCWPSAVREPPAMTAGRRLLYPIYHLEQALKRYLDANTRGWDAAISRPIRKRTWWTSKNLQSSSMSWKPNPGSKLDPRLRELFGDLIDQKHGAIGRVVASEQEPAGSHSFYFWANEDQRTLDVGHIVVGFSEDAAVIGVVDEPRRYSDLRSFLDDFFDRQIEEAIESQTISKRPEILVFEVTVLRTKHERDDVDSHRPVIAGPVYYATQEAIDYALGVEHDFAGAPIAALAPHQWQLPAGRARQCRSRRAWLRGLPALAHLDRRALSARPGSGSRQLDRPIRARDQDQPRPVPDQRGLPAAARGRHERRRADVQRQGRRPASGSTKRALPDDELRRCL